MRLEVANLRPRAVTGLIWAFFYGVRKLTKLNTTHRGRKFQALSSSYHNKLANRCTTDGYYATTGDGQACSTVAEDGKLNRKHLRDSVTENNIGNHPWNKNFVSKTCIFEVPTMLDCVYTFLFHSSRNYFRRTKRDFHAKHTAVNKIVMWYILLNTHDYIWKGTTYWSQFFV